MAISLQGPMTTATNNGATDADRETEPSAKDILSQLERILASPDFARAGRMKVHPRVVQRWISSC